MGSAGGGSRAGEVRREQQGELQLDGGEGPVSSRNWNCPGIARVGGAVSRAGGGEG